MKKVPALSLLLFLSIATFAQSSQNKEAVLNRYFDLYNNHQVNDLVEMVVEDFRMYSVVEDTMTTDITGKTQLRKWLTKYFKDFPDTASKISEVSVSGNYVSFIETAQWGKNKSQSSLAVYEVVDNKIRRAWYYY